MKTKDIKENNIFKIIKKTEYKNFDKNMINEIINNMEINKLIKKSSSSRSRVTCRDWKEESNKENYNDDGSWPVAILSF